MRVAGQGAVNAQSSALHEASHFTLSTEAERFQLPQHHIGTAVVDCCKIDVLWRHPRHGTGTRSRTAEPDLEEVGAVGDSIGRGGMAFSNSHDIYGIVWQVTGAVRRGHYHCAGAIGLQAAVQDTKR